MMPTMASLTAQVQLSATAQPLDESDPTFAPKNEADMGAFQTEPGQVISTPGYLRSGRAGLHRLASTLLKLITRWNHSWLHKWRHMPRRACSSACKPGSVHTGRCALHLRLY